MVGMTTWKKTEDSVLKYKESIARRGGEEKYCESN